MKLWKTTTGNMDSLAEYIIRVAYENDLSITNLQLQGIMYFAFKDFAQRNCHKRSLLDTFYDAPFQVWKYGVGIETIYDEYRIYGSTPIPLSAISKQKLSDLLSGLDSQLSEINPTIIKYLKYPLFELVQAVRKSLFWQDHCGDLRKEGLGYGNGWRSLTTYTLADILTDIDTEGSGYKSNYSYPLHPEPLPQHPDYHMDDLAHHILGLAQQHHQCVSNLQLQKIMYFSLQYLLNHHHRLFVEQEYDRPFMVWRYGPVDPVSYDAYRIYGSEPITDSNFSIVARYAEIEGLDKFIVDDLFGVTAFELVTRSQQNNFWQANIKYLTKDTDKGGSGSVWRSNIPYKIDDLID